MCIIMLPAGPEVSVDGSNRRSLHHRHPWKVRSADFDPSRGDFRRPALRPKRGNRKMRWVFGPEANKYDRIRSEMQLY
jgi:hypothetical protein